MGGGVGPLPRGSVCGSLWVCGPPVGGRGAWGTVVQKKVLCERLSKVVVLQFAIAAAGLSGLPAKQRIWVRYASLHCSCSTGGGGVVGGWRYTRGGPPSPYSGGCPLRRHHKGAHAVHPGSLHPGWRTLLSR